MLMHLFCIVLNKKENNIINCNFQVRQPRANNTEGRGTRRVRVPHSTRDRQKAEVVNRGEHIMAPTQLRRYNIEPQYRPEALYQGELTKR